MKKYVLDLRVTENTMLSHDYFLLKLTAENPLPEMRPGQFVEVRIDGSPPTFLRRPLSINFVDREKNELWLLVQNIGPGTCRMATYRVGEMVNLLMPLGNGFTLPNKYSVTTTGEEEQNINNGFTVSCDPDAMRFLLIGGGVGTAPLLFLGDELKQAGFEPVFLTGARREEDLVQLPDFCRLGKVYVTTEDGSMGEKGYVIDHSVLHNAAFDRIYTCGPKPMMVAVAKYAVSKGIDCEVSLENTMTCGFGACLCCVEQTIEGHKCVCTEGPVFNINQLKWLS